VVCSSVVLTIYHVRNSTDDHCLRESNMAAEHLSECWHAIGCRWCQPQQEDWKRMEWLRWLAGSRLPQTVIVSHMVWHESYKMRSSWNTAFMTVLMKLVSQMKTAATWQRRHDIDVICRIGMSSHAHALRLNYLRVIDNLSCPPWSLIGFLTCIIHNVGLLAMPGRFETHAERNKVSGRWQ